MLPSCSLPAIAAIETAPFLGHGLTENLAIEIHPQLCFRIRRLAHRYKVIGPIQKHLVSVMEAIIDNAPFPVNPPAMEREQGTQERKLLCRITIVSNTISVPLLVLLLLADGPMFVHLIEIGIEQDGTAVLLQETSSKTACPVLVDSLEQGERPMCCLDLDAQTRTYCSTLFGKGNF